MPVVPTPPTILDGITPSSVWNQFRDAIRFLQTPPLAQLRQTVAQSLTTGVATAITFDVEDVDSDVDGTGGHSTSSNTSKFTARYAGYYWLGGGVGYASNATGVRTVEWAVNGILINGSGVITAAASGVSTRVPARGIPVYLNIGDSVECYAFQNSGGPLNTGVSGVEQSSMAVNWVST